MMILPFLGFLFDQKRLIFEEMAPFRPKGIKIPIFETKKVLDFSHLKMFLGTLPASCNKVTKKIL